MDSEWMVMWMGEHRGKTGSDESTGVTGAAP